MYICLLKVKSMGLLLVKNDSNSEVVSDTKNRMFGTDLPYFLWRVSFRSLARAHELI